MADQRYLDWIKSGLGRGTGRTQQGLGDALGITQPNVSKLLKGERGLDVSEVAKVARYIGKPPPAEIVVPIVGYVQAGGEMILRDAEQGWLGEAPLPPHGDPVHTVAVEVRGASMAGRIADGDIVYYDDRRDPPTESLLGRLCVVGLADGRAMVKRLIRGSKPGLFHLLSAAEDPIQDAEVSWAARVIWIQPKS